MMAIYRRPLVAVKKIVLTPFLLINDPTTVLYWMVDARQRAVHTILSGHY